MAPKLQSPGPVFWPFAAHSFTTSSSFGEKPLAFTSTVSGDRNPLSGSTVICWPAVGGLVDTCVVGGVVVEGTTVVVDVGARRPHDQGRATTASAQADGHRADHGDRPQDLRPLEATSCHKAIEPCVPGTRQGPKT
jgi:hypothetical protein